MPNSTKITILIADDHDLVRAGIAALLKGERDIQVVGEADDGREALEKVRSLSPRIVLMDLTMPEMDGMEATRLITQDFPNTKVLVLTQHEHEEYIRRVINSGASGYLVKNSLAGDLLRAIRAVHKGEKYFDPVVNRVMADAYVRMAAGDKQESIILTKRETEILRFIAEGNTNQQTASKLHLSVRTVEFHRANIAQKIGKHDTASLVKYAIQQGMVKL
jgi:two-component system, NarL family, response regulator NreC